MGDKKFAGVKVGDEVLVFESRRGYVLRDKYADGVPGKVTGVRRAYFTVECEGRRYLSGDFSIQTGGGQKHGFVMTQEMIAREHLRYAAEDIIKARGLDVTPRARFSTEQLVAIADLLKSFEEE